MKNTITRIFSILFSLDVGSDKAYSGFQLVLVFAAIATITSLLAFLF